MEQYFLIPILMVIASGLIYVFGFKKTQEPKFKKIAETSSSSNRSASQKANNSNRKKEKSATQNSEKKSEKIKADVSGNNKKKLSDPVVQKQEPQTASQNVKKNVESAKPAAKSAVSKSAKDKSKSKKADKAKLDISSGDQPKVQNDDDGWFEVVNKRNKKNDENKNDKTKEKQQVSPSKTPVKGQKKDDKVSKSNKQNSVKSPKISKTDSIDAQSDNTPKSEAQRVIIEVSDAVHNTFDNDKENQSQNNQTSVKANNIDQTPIVAPVHQKTEVAGTVETVSETKTPSGIVFDELGDSWTEAKAPKKSKKKVRKD